MNNRAKHVRKSHTNTHCGIGIEDDTDIGDLRDAPWLYPDGWCMACIVTARKRWRGTTVAESGANAGSGLSVRLAFGEKRADLPQTRRPENQSAE